MELWSAPLTVDQIALAAGKPRKRVLEFAIHRGLPLKRPDGLLYSEEDLEWFRSHWFVGADQYRSRFGGGTMHHFVGVARRLGIEGKYSKPAGDRIELVERVCLSCHKPFMSRHKFHRVCDDCKTSDVWICGLDTEYPVRLRR